MGTWNPQVSTVVIFSLLFELFFKKKLNKNFIHILYNIFMIMSRINFKK